MKPSAVLISAVVLAAAGRATAQSPLTLERIVGAPALAGTSPVAATWAPDSRTLAFLWNDRQLPSRGIWLVDRDGRTPRRLDPAGEGVSAIEWAPDARSLYFLRDGDAWRIGTSGAEAPQRLTTDGGDKSDLRVSPDGRWLSWLRDGDLWLLPASGGTPNRVTQLGIAPIGSVPLGTYFRRDREVGGATWGGDAPAYAWAPDARRIALHVVDRRRVREVGIPYYLGDSVRMNRLRRSYPGDTNEVRRIGLLDLDDRRVRWVPLPGEDATRVVDFSWSPSGTLLIDRESDDAIDRWVHIVPAGDTLPRLVWDDHRPTRIYNDVASAWLPDGRVLLTGDLDDRYRLYALSPGTRALQPLSPSTSDVTGAGIPTPAGIVFVGNAPSPYERHAWLLPSRGGAPRQLTTAAGHHQPIPSPDGSTLALISSDEATPPELHLGPMPDGRAAPVYRRITTSPTAAFGDIGWQRARYVSFPHRSEPWTIHARIIEPPGLDRSRRYPVLIGPAYSNTVRNRWGGLNGFVQQLLVARGYVVVQVDVRGSTGYGRDFREAFLMDWGGRDLDDLESTVEYLKRQSWVDPDRFGIWGSSYGGTLTVYSLLRKPGLFRAGVAAAPATDPRFFGSDDVAIARRPQSHPATFLRGAAQYAGNLRDHLLIIHGMQDDVVPFKTTVDLSDALMRAGKDFEVAFAPAATHAWTQRPWVARYLYQRLIDHFDRHLGAGPR